MGRRAKPTAEKKRLGNPGKQKLNENEPKPTGRAYPPDYLDDYGREVWTRIITAMPDEMYTACDSDILASYCIAASSLRCAVLINNGKVERPEDTSVKDWLRIQKEQSTLLASIGSRLGLDPSARTAIRVPEKKTKSKFGKYQAIQGGKR